jgi:hypothetical protein
MMEFMSFVGDVLDVTLFTMLTMRVHGKKKIGSQESGSI